ncbi:MAG: ATP-binding protein, partial [Prochlorotrichaceae cyanobacterium]
MSHELRTPLNGILGYAQILTRTQPNEDQRQQGLEVIYQSGSHLLTLINDVLDLAKIEARKLELFPTPCHLPALIQGVVEIARIRAEQKSLVFQYHVGPNLPEGVLVDEKRLRQVLLNLLSNAIKFTEKGEVTIAVSTISKSMQNGIPQVQINFKITDTGVGISPEEMDRIFHPFEQVGNPQGRKEGTGLGLSITRTIIELMDSHIHVQSEPVMGSTFEFMLTLDLVENWADFRSTTALGRIIGYEGDRKKILVIDDRWENRIVLTSLLTPLGFDLQEAVDGNEGLKKTQENIPDLIITDLKMPGMDGWTLIQEIRRAESSHHIPIVVSSASV